VPLAVLIAKNDSANYRSACFGIIAVSDRKQPSQVPGTSGKLIVLALLILGLIGGYFLYRNVPRTNPKHADPGSPYYSPPSDEELKKEKAEELKAIREEEEKANAKLKSEK